MKRKINAFDFALLILSIGLCIGTATVFKTCAPKEDGSWMTCHWAQQAVIAIAGGMFILSIVRFSSESAVCVGLDFAAAVMAILTALIPGFVIPLCTMATMHCHVMFRPFDMVISALVIVVSIIDAALRMNQIKNEK